MTLDRYDVEVMLSDTTRSLRRDIAAARELTEMRYREAMERLEEEVAALQRVLDARTESAV